MKTYCDKSSENELVLHGTPEEIAFILDLVNSIEHPTATKLRKVLEPVVRSHDRFQLIVERKIEVCGKCKGEGYLMVGNLVEGHNNDREDCYRCKGAGRKTKITSIRYENIVCQTADLLEGE